MKSLGIQVREPSVIGLHGLHGLTLFWRSLGKNTQPPQICLARGGCCAIVLGVLGESWPDSFYCPKAIHEIAY